MTESSVSSQSGLSSAGFVSWGPRSFQASIYFSAQFFRWTASRERPESLPGFSIQHPFYTANQKIKEIIFLSFITSWTTTIQENGIWNFTPRNTKRSSEQFKGKKYLVTQPTTSISTSIYLYSFLPKKRFLTLTIHHLTQNTINITICEQTRKNWQSVWRNWESWNFLHPNVWRNWESWNFLHPNIR